MLVYWYNSHHTKAVTVWNPATKKYGKHLTTENQIQDQIQSPAVSQKAIVEAIQNCSKENIKEKLVELCEGFLAFPETGEVSLFRN